MRGNSLRHDKGQSALRKPVVITKVVETIRDRDREWVLRFGRGLGLAALVSGLLWGVIVLVLRAFF